MGSCRATASRRSTRWSEWAVLVTWREGRGRSALMRLPAGVGAPWQGRVRLSAGASRSGVPHQAGAAAEGHEGSTALRTCATPLEAGPPWPTCSSASRCWSRANVSCSRAARTPAGKEMESGSGQPHKWKCCEMNLVPSSACHQQACNPAAPSPQAHPGPAPVPRARVCAGAGRRRHRAASRWSRPRGAAARCRRWEGWTGMRRRAR